VPDEAVTSCARFSVRGVAGRVVSVITTLLQTFRMATRLPAAVMLSPIEATRVTAVLEEALEKLSFLSSMTPEILSHRDEVSALVGDEISRIISDQRALELRYEALIDQRAGLKDLSHKNKYKELQREVQNVAYQLRESMKNLCRSLKENPDVGANLTRCVLIEKCMGLLRWVATLHTNDDSPQTRR